MIQINKLPPFKRMCVTIGNLPTSFMESMSYYEALEWLYKYLADTIIPTVNNTGEAVTELQNAFTLLQSYVENYFDNLDVQEEINNKLDAMAESGELQEIIESYIKLNGVTKFDTVNEMKESDNLVDGSSALTLGVNNIGDSNPLLWIISENYDNTKINVELDSGLYAICLSKVVNTLLFNLTNINDLDNYDLSSIDEVIVDKNYNMTDKLELSNIILNLNNKTITLDNEIHLNFILDDNTTIKNGKIMSTDYTHLTEGNGICIKVTGDNVVVDNMDLNGFYSVYASSSIDNLEVKNCKLNSYRLEVFLLLGKFTNINIHDNIQEREHNYTTPAQHNNVIQISNGIHYPVSEDEITNTVLNNHGDTIIIKNNKCNTLNVRAFNIINCHNVIIEENYIINPFGDKTGHTLVGYSDDIIVVDLCRYGSISNNTIINSGENGIDLLGSQFFTVDSNKITGTDADGIDTDKTDQYTLGGIADGVSNDELLTSNISITNNVIESVNLGIRIGGIDINANSNSILPHPNYVTRVGFAFTSNDMITAHGSFGTINLVGNMVDKNMNLGQSGTGTINLVEASDLTLDENSGRKETLSIDNTALDNDSDTKLYYIAHNMWTFKHFKIYYEDPNVSGHYLELPLGAYDNHGIVATSNQKYYLFMTMYKHFVNAPIQANTNVYRNLTTGTFKVIFF